MDAKAKRIIMEKVRGYLNAGWHCSERMLLAVGEHYLGEVSPQALRAPQGALAEGGSSLCNTLNGSRDCC